VTESYADVAAAPTGGLEVHPLLTEPLLLALPAGWQPVPLAQLRDAPWVAGLAGTQYAVAVEHACRAAGFEPRFVHRADEAAVLHGLVAAGLGVALIPALAYTPSEAVQIVEATPAPPRRHVSALVRRGAARRPALAATLGALKAASSRR
jgi:DNA-binding transcriptional LysR family regulator